MAQNWVPNASLRICRLGGWVLCGKGEENVETEMLFYGGILRCDFMHLYLFHSNTLSHWCLAKKIKLTYNL